MPTRIVIERFFPTNKASLASKWQGLEFSAKPSIFLSWPWIENWLDLVTNPLFLVEAYQGDKVVGLGLFVERTRRVFGCFPFKQWWLHRTGNQQQDQIWIEYNDFLLDETCSIAVREQMIKAVSKFDSSIKEIIIGLSDIETIDSFTTSFTELGFSEESRIKTNGYIAKLSQSNVDYETKTQSKNTRVQISRSKKILQSQGELLFNVYSSPEKLLELFPKIASIHIDKWGHTIEGSGFLNPLFDNFHKSLAMSNSTNMLQVAVLTLNEVDLGYLVNFVYNNKVYFYLSALHNISDNKIKIGLTLHNEAIQYYDQQGIESYDFLGGDARYKKSLSNKEYGLEMKRYYRNDFILRIERILKGIKRKMKNVTFKRF